MVDDDGAIWRDCVTLNHHRAFFLTHVLHDHGHQHFTHQGSATLEVAHHVRQRLVGLLHLGLLLNAAGGRAASSTESPCCCRVHALNGLTRVGQHVQLLLVHLVVALHCKTRSGLGHVGGIQHDVGIQSAHGAAELIVRHSNRALGALYAVCAHAPAQARVAAVERVLLVEHVADVAKWHTRTLFAEAPERRVGEIAVRVRRWPVEKHMRAKPVAAAHTGHHGAAVLHQAICHGMHMGRVGLVVLHHAAVWALEHHHIHPAAIPQLGCAHLFVVRVVPAVFLHRPFAGHVPSPIQARALAADILAAVFAPPACTGLAKALYQLRVLREHTRQAAGVHPALTAQPSCVGHVVALAGPVPVDFVTADR